MTAKLGFYIRVDEFYKNYFVYETITYASYTALS